MANTVPLPFIVGAGVMLLAILVVLLFVREPDLSDQPLTQEESRGQWRICAKWRRVRTKAACFCSARSSWQQRSS